MTLSQRIINHPISPPFKACPASDGEGTKGRFTKRIMTKIFNRKSEKKRRITLRKSMPKAEVILWSRLKGKQIYGYKFRRQHSIGPYIVDFYCPKLKLSIEVDGSSHFKQKAKLKDMERQKYIESFGIRFLRYLNTDIYENLDGVVNHIWNTINENMKVNCLKY